MPEVKKAYAKINLVLEALGRREDGYHEVATVLHAVDVADRLTFEPSRDISLECDTPALAGEENLVMRTARLLQRATECFLGARIRLQKCIPVAAGLGGGSSDAAATLLALNGMWGLGLSPQRLGELGARLGSDVPFFLQDAGCALATGRGEVVTAVPPAVGRWVVILKPDISPPPNKTAVLYSLLREGDFTDGSKAATVTEGLRAGCVRAEGMYNAFERIAGQAFPGLEGWWRALEEAGATFVALAGSGPALYTLVDTAEEGRRLQEALAGRGHEAYLAGLRETTRDG